MQDQPYRLMAPGPVAMPHEVCEVLAQPMIHHRTPEFTAILKRVLMRLPEVFGTHEPVMLHTSTGSGAMESAIVNTLSPGDEILVIESGKFGQRWSKIAEAYGIRVQTIKVPPGEAVRLRDVGTALNNNENIRAVLGQACETSTGVLHPVEEIAELVHSRVQTIFILDAITAIGAMHLPMDKWHIDVVIAGSQKAFMMPTGLSFIAMSEKAWGFYELAKCPRFYWDLKPELEANKKFQTRFSSAVSHIRALDIVLDRLTGDNLDLLVKRTESLALATRQAGNILGLSLFAKNPSPSLTAFCVPRGVDGDKWRKHMEEAYNVTVMGGQDELKGKILRVGHIGDISDEDLVATIRALGESLNQISAHEISDETINLALTEAKKVLVGEF